MKKGFTLIELLAVIVILAIIGLIALPATSNYVTKSQIASYKTSVQNVMEAAKEYVGKYEENNDFPEGGIDITETNLKIKNNEFKSGIIKRNENGEIEALNVYDGKYCANGTKQNMVIEKVNSLEECSSVDASKPDLKVKVVNVTSTKINITAIGRDAQTGIKDYKYCIGDECSDYTTSSSYQFNNLKNGTEYEITVMVRNNNYGKGEQYTEEVTTNTKTIKVKTQYINMPEFKISSSNYSTSKEITIIYSGAVGYKNIYQIIDIDGNIIEEKEVADNETTVLMSQNGILKAIITNGEETLENELVINGIDKESPEVYVIMSDEWEKNKQIEVIVNDNGSGLATKPYSYNGGKSWVNNKYYTLTQNTTIKLVVRDKLNNQTTTYKVCTQKDKEENPINCKEETVDEIVIDKIDTVKPTCTLKVTSGTLGLNDWYTSDATVDFDKFYDEAVDPNDSTKLIAGSGIVESNISIRNLTKEGTTKITGTVVDKLGNENTCEIIVKLDKTAPNCGTITLSGTMGTNNWYTSDISITKKDGSDSVSGHSSTKLNYSSITTDTAGTTIVLTTTDNAGNVCKAEKTVKLDKTKPTCGTISLSGTKGLNSWYTSDVTISKADGADAMSGHLSTILSHTSITSETTGTKVTLTTTDNAGNVCTTNQTIKIDKTAPTYTLTPVGTAHISGYRSGLKVTATCSDSISSITSGNQTKTLTTKGWNTVSGTCINEAGLQTGYSNDYLIYVYTADQAACGTTEVDCNPYSCNWSDCATGNPSTCVGGQVVDYNNCTSYSCTLYKSCTLTHNCGHTDQNACINHASSTGGSCATEGGGEWVHTYKTTGRQSGCGTETVTGSACNNASSKKCVSYGTKWDDCATTTNTCQGGYTSTCYQKCTVAATCWHT